MESRSGSGAERWFAKSHEWVTVQGDTATVGITDYAQVSHARGPDTEAVCRVVSLVNGGCLVESECEYSVLMCVLRNTHRVRERGGGG